MGQTLKQTVRGKLRVAGVYYRLTGFRPEMDPAVTRGAYADPGSPATEAEGATAARWRPGPDPPRGRTDNLGYLIEE
jgi:hypothetical protein